MNATYAKVLALTFFFGVGIFNVARGVVAFRSRKESKILGSLRLALGILMLIAPILLLYFLRSGPGV